MQMFLKDEKTDLLEITGNSKLKTEVYDMKESFLSLFPLWA
jgi:hypothetical protein